MCLLCVYIFFVEEERKLVRYAWLTYRDNSIVTETQPSRRSDQIKTFIRNIGLPAPPVIGRKISAPPTAPISSSMATGSSAAAVEPLPAIASSPTHRSSDAISLVSLTATPRHSVSSHTHTPCPKISDTPTDKLV